MMDDPWSPSPDPSRSRSVPPSGPQAAGPAPTQAHGQHLGPAPSPGPQGPPGQPRPIAGEERPFWLGLILAIVTLGFYHYWWHYLTHDETCRQIGRPNKEKGLWFGYVAISVGSMVLVLVGILMLIGALGPELFLDEVDEEVLAERLIAQGGLAILLIVVGALAALVSPVLILIFAHKQATVLTEAFSLYGRPNNVSAGPFIGLYVGSILGGLFIPGLGIILLPIAYYTLQDPYNRFWRLAKYGQEHQTGYGYAPAPPGAAGYGGPQNPSSQSSYGGPPMQQHAPPPTAPARPMGPYGQPAPALVEQPFRCPRCHAHVTARGEPNTQVHVQCPSCGQSGDVMLGRM